MLFYLRWGVLGMVRGGLVMTRVGFIMTRMCLMKRGREKAMIARVWSALPGAELFFSKINDFQRAACFARRGISSFENV